MVEYIKYETKSGTKLWRYDHSIGYSYKTGEQDRLRKRGFRTKESAKIHFERQVELYKKGLTGKEKRLKFKELYEEFLVFYRHTGVEGSTVRKFKSEVENLVLPSIGKFFIDSISISDCQKMVESIKIRRKDFRKIILVKIQSTNLSLLRVKKCTKKQESREKITCMIRINCLNF